LSGSSSIRRRYGWIARSTSAQTTRANVASASLYQLAARRQGYTPPAGGGKTFAIARTSGRTQGSRQINGVVFNDTDSDSVQNANEPARQTFAFYIDANNNTCG